MAIDLIKTHPGVGKTYATASILKESPDSVLWFSPTYQQASEVQALIPEAYLVRGRGKMVEDEDLACIYINSIEHAQKNGLDATAIYCKRKCGLIDSCPYFEQFEIAQEKRVVILMHAFLKTNIPTEISKKWWVIDENIFGDYRENKDISKESLDFSSSVVNWALNKVNDSIRDKSHMSGLTYARTLLQELAAHINLLYRGLTGERFPLEISAVTWEFLMDAYDECHKGEDRRLIVQDILRFTSETELRAVGEGDWDYIHTSFLPRNNVVILDATQSEDNLKAIFGEETDIRVFSSSDFNIEQYAETIQVYGANFGRTVLVDMEGRDTGAFERIVEVVSEICHGEPYHLITHKKVVDTLKLEARFGEDKVNWFGNTRGLNTMKDAENLVIVGTYMPPLSELVEGARVLYNQQWDSEEEVERALADLGNTEWMPVRFTDPKHEPLHLRQRKFSNPYVQLYYQHSVVSEVEQAVGRARINEPSDQKRRLIIVSNHISEFVTIDRVIPVRKAMTKRSKQQEAILVCIQQLLDSGVQAGDITPKLLKRELGGQVSIRTIGRHYKDLMMELL